MIRSTRRDVDQATVADLLDRKAETHALLAQQQDLARRKKLSPLEEERHLDNAARIGANLRYFQTTLTKKNYNDLLSNEFHLNWEAIRYYEGWCE